MHIFMSGSMNLEGGSGRTTYNTGRKEEIIGISVELENKFEKLHLEKYRIVLII